MSTAAELAYLGAADALAAFRARTLSPVELMEAVIARAEEVEPSVNALCHRFFDEALEAAGEAERRYARGEARPLEGLPVAIKEEEEVAGQPETMGSLLYRDHVPEATSNFAARILEAGAIVHARSTAPEFSCTGFTHSKLWGVTRNPWNLDYAVGGSSGGSGASLAAGTSTLASGSDIGGSIRIPASFCGVVGFKPPYGRVPAAPPFNLDHYCHCGPLARTVADCAIFEDALAGPAADDVVSLRPKVELGTSFADAAGLRVALSVDLGDWPVDDDVAANTRRAGELLGDAGAVVEEVELAFPREATLQAAAIHFSAIFVAWIESEIRRGGDLINDYVHAMVDWCRRTAAGADFYAGLELEGQLYTPLGRLLERYDLLLCPTAGTAGLEAGESYVGRRLVVGGRELDFYFEGFMTAPFNVASRCPVLSVPSGRAGNGVPTGAQLVGRTYDDATPFRAGAALEAALAATGEWPRRPPALTG